MKNKKKKTICVLLLVGCILLGYFIWVLFRPVKIIAVHQRGSNFSAVLVKNFPFTDKGKIKWWLENKSILKGKYNVPNPAKDGFFHVTFWLFGDGYKEEGKYDRLCFDDMKTKANCIEKKPVFTVDKSRNMGVMFTVYEGGDYRLKQDGEIVKVQR